MKYSFCFLLFCSRVVFANPVGEAVVAGDVEFARPSENQLHVTQTTDRAIVKWEKFSIDAHEVAKFLQPGPESVLLNQVVGGEISKIYGRLEANGQIILMNPQGVLVGKTGVINAASFLPTRQEIPSAAFMDGSFQMQPIDYAEVINVEGRIEGTRVSRLGERVFLVADEAPGQESSAIAYPTQTNQALEAMQQIRTLIPERLWVQEFSILIDRQAFRDHIKTLIDHRKREGTIQSRFALASSRDYLVRSTMSGENIRLMDRYQEFEQSPFWRTPEMLETLYWLEDRE